MDAYQDFLDRKAQVESVGGFAPTFMPSQLFDFQAFIVDRNTRRGRSATFADCGMGKTYQELVWGQNVVEHTNGRVLLLAPLAVAAQTVREAQKFDIEAHRSHDGKPAGRITVANYDKLHLFDPDDYVGAICDESGILKNFNGATRGAVTQFMRKMTYRLLASATPSPNDYIELGTSSEALGYLGHMDMLNRFFKNQLNNSATGRMRGQAAKWCFKGHAELPFWRWVCSWALAVRKPSDLGFDDGPFVLPPLIEEQHVVYAEKARNGMLFSLPAVGLAEERDERRLTIRERCEKVAKLTDHRDPALVWCHLNDEGALLREMMPDAVEVAGSDRDEVKEERLLAFAAGQIRRLITKPKIGAWGMNFQICAHQTTFPSHSFEQYYQTVRRSWRFGQTRPVKIDIVTSEGEADVLANQQAKARKAEAMFANMIAEMNGAVSIDRQRVFTNEIEAPAWL